MKKEIKNPIIPAITTSANAEAPIRPRRGTKVSTTPINILKVIIAGRM